MKRVCKWYLPPLLIVTVFLTGCALSKPTHQPGLITRWNHQEASSSTASPPIDLVFGARRICGDDRPSSSFFRTWESNRAVQRALNKTLPQFPILANASPHLTDAPYQLVIEATQTEGMSERDYYVSAFSLCLIPTQEKLEVELEARLFRRPALLKTYRATGAHQLTVHLLLLPFGGFRYRVPSRTIENTFCDLFLQIQRDAPELFQTTQAQGT